ncbi:MAG: N,N'-diacetylchitobiose phosphorylase [Oligoflexia bacterium]|nr:N,N'-diacetylchitobiose phosphorylase [Oligoflexia bacterium]
MQYGYFDDQNREYVITNPATPASWTNYLGDTKYGAIITNNAGGYSFYQSAAQGRFMRFRPNAIPMDQPGRYIYVRDMESKDYWSASWQPVGKDLSVYKSECRHGTAYTSITSEYSGIKTETLFFVPLGKDYECWKVKVTNTENKKRKLRFFTYVEYVGNWMMLDDFFNLQYSQYIIKMDFKDGIIDHGTNVFMPPMPEKFEEKDQGRHTFLGVAGAKVTAYDTDRQKFIGLYRSYNNPAVVEKGECTGSLATADNGCGTVQVDVELNPGESKEFAYVMGIGRAEVEGKKAVSSLDSSEKVNREFEQVRTYWHSKLGSMSVKTPDPEFNSMMNVWNPYNSLITFAWSRAASLVYSGARDGLGYRDTAQDFLGVIHNIPEMVKERMELLITGQVSNGGAMPVVKPYAHTPGKEKAPAEDKYRSDDCLWLFNCIPAFVKETGDIDFYNKVLPYADQGEDTVLGHLKKAIQFNMERRGAHGLPCGLAADWNDCLQLGYKGESVFVAFQLRYAFATYIDICELLGNKKEKEWAEKQLKEYDKVLDEQTWDGDWYIRAYRHDGLKFGSKESMEGQVFLNAQTWAVFSGHARGEKAKKAMKTVEERLASKYGLALNDTPFEKMDFSVVKATLYNKGMKENAGIFCHTQGWAVIAETLLGNGEQAYRYYRAFMPAAYNTIAEVREIEPYVYCQSTHSPSSPRFGASRLPWLSGAAAWAYYSTASYIMGIRPEYNGLTIDPCIPSDWKEFSVYRKFRGKDFNITVENPRGVQKGVSKIVLNGEEIKNNLIPAGMMKDSNKVTVVMG